jgi:hypothetical protein
MPTIRPFRDVDEHNVRNLYSWGGTIPALKGQFVNIQSGWDSDQELSEIGSPGATYGNTVSLRYGTKPTVTGVVLSGQQALGVLLWDVREYDENGEKLLFNRTKQHQMQCALSGQAVPIATRGMFHFSGVQGTPIAGQPAYLHTDGGLVAVPAGVTVTATKVGKFLGAKDSKGWVLVDVECNG